MNIATCMSVVKKGVEFWTIKYPGSSLYYKLFVCEMRCVDLFGLIALAGVMSTYLGIVLNG